MTTAPDLHKLWILFATKDADFQILQVGGGGGERRGKKRKRRRKKRGLKRNKKEEEKKRKRKVKIQVVQVLPKD